MSNRIRGRVWMAGGVATLAVLGWWPPVGVAGVADSATKGSAQARSALRSVRDGVYTEAQAERGNMQYRLACEHCHLSDLGGSPVDEAPSLVRDAFLARWGGKTARDLFDTMSKTMPADAPGSLSRRDYIDLIAYILQVNDYPAGSVELERDPEAIRQILIDGPSD